jgi:hypothetical protein
MRESARERDRESTREREREQENVRCSADLRMRESSRRGLVSSMRGLVSSMLSGERARARKLARERDSRRS